MTDSLVKGKAYRPYIGKVIGYIPIELGIIAFILSE
jgi:hypothetical protein